LRGARRSGHHALTNCAWSLGDRDGGAVGYLVGKPHRGLGCMFRMMNAMRIEVGIGAAMLGKRGLQASRPRARCAPARSASLGLAPPVRVPLAWGRAFLPDGQGRRPSSCGSEQ